MTLRLMEDILTTIVAHKRREIVAQKEAVDAAVLAEACDAAPAPRSMRKSLEQSASGIIAEFKRRSPSKGWINRMADPALVVPSYEQAGAGALSILTDEKFFGGSLGDVRAARPLTALPILRKDFVVDEYQLLQARAVGADAVLLIAACLELQQCRRLAARAHELGMEVLLEIHREEELEYVTPEMDMVGINNRNLGTFVTDVQNSFRLAARLRARAEALERVPLLVSESGLADAATVNALRRDGFRGFLIGETFMKTENPGQALSQFVAGIEA